MTRRRLQVGRSPSADRLVSMLQSLDLKDRKDALQMICEALEAGYRIVPDENLQFARLIAAQRNSSDAPIRRWFYKYVGLSRQVAYVPVLLDRIGREDDQTAAWMIGALTALIGLEPAQRELTRRGIAEELVVNAGVFSAYFLPETVDRATVRTVVVGDNSLLERWASFLSVRVAEPELDEYTRSLNTAEDPEVAEFSVWAGGRVSGLDGTSLQPDGIADLPPQVRRWAYYAVASDPEARSAYADVLWAARENESEERVREGAVAGLTRGTIQRGWNEFLQEWGRTDVSDRIRRMIEDALAESPEVEEHGLLVRPRRARSATPMKGQTQMFGVPKIEAHDKEMIYLMALDTVKFSESSDGNQLRVVEAFLGYLAKDRRLLALSPDQVIPLFTGDGIILGIRGADNARVTLEIALALQEDFDELHKFQMRVGLHCGSAQILAMSDGSTQLLGHAINESARVMSGGKEGAVTISDSYYNEVLHRGRERLVGYALTERVVTDKHGHKITCFDVTPN